MKRIHFNGKGPVWWHYFFWQPWGCLGCLGRGIGFLLLLTLFLFLLSQFRSCNRSATRTDDVVVEEVVADTIVDLPTDVIAVPPIDEDDVIEEDNHRLVANRINVLFDAETDESDARTWSERFNELYPGDEYRIIFYDPNTKLMSIQVPASQRREIIENLPAQIPDIKFIVFEESVMQMTVRPDDPFFRDADTAWYYEPIGVFDAWDVTRGAEDVIVAVVDSYFDINGEEFSQANVVSPYSVVNASSDVSVPDGFNPRRPDLVLAHGTMVSGLIFGAYNNGKGAAGIAPECSFMPVSLGRTFGSLAMLQGLLYSINHGAKVVNISAGLQFTDAVGQLSEQEQIELSRRILLDQESVWKYVFDMARKFYVTIVWAAGNENMFTALDASKRGENTIKVSAVDQRMRKADFSNFGNFARQQIFESTVSAPGVAIYGQLPGTAANTLVDGTSFAAPIVAGAVGLIKSVDMSLTTAEIAEILRQTGRQMTGSSSTIGPVININAALMKVRDNFLPFSVLEEFTSDSSGMLTIPTTLLSSLNRPDDDDSTALPPMIGLSFSLDSPTTGKVFYTSSLEPESPWSADLRVERDGDKLIFIQEDAAERDSSPYSFSSGKFTVAADDNGYATVVDIESESVDCDLFFLKKADS